MHQAQVSSGPRAGNSRPLAHFVVRYSRNRTLDFSYNLLRTLLPASSSTPPLSALPQLETVYFIQNKLSRIEGLDGVANTLRSLELGGNRIREIKGIEKLVNLEELWLGKNKIRKLEVREGGSRPEKRPPPPAFS